VLLVGCLYYVLLGGFGALSVSQQGVKKRWGLDVVVALVRWGRVDEGRGC